MTAGVQETDAWRGGGGGLEGAQGEEGAGGLEGVQGEEGRWGGAWRGLGRGGGGEPWRGAQGEEGAGAGAGVVRPGDRRPGGNTAVRATACQALTVYKAICITGVISHSYNSARQVF